MRRRVDVKRVARVAAPALAAALLAWSAPPDPDGWDGLGFVASVERFDMDRFAPHPPGYPVYVACVKLVHLVVPSPLAACYVVAAAGGLAAAALAGAAARRALGAGGAWPAAIAALCTPLAWRAASAVGTESLALALAMLAVWALTAPPSARSATALGAAVGLGLGVRLSWAPLFLPMLFLARRGARLRAACAAAAGTCAWLVPLVAHVGPRHLARLFAEHAAGHFERWGGSVATRPGAARLAYAARDVLVDGLGVDADALGIFLALAALALAARAALAWRRAGWRGARAAATVLVPYSAWMLLGQNVAQQPRHALPLVVALGAALAVAAARGGALDRALGAALFALVVGRAARDAAARRAVPPAGAQLVALVRALPDPAGALVFGGASARFFERTELAARAENAGSLGDAALLLTRRPELPRRAFVTSELADLDAAQGALTPVATLCRPARLDRQAPCLGVYEWAFTR